MIDIVQDTVEAFELPAGMCLTVRNSTPGSLASISLLAGSVTMAAASTTAGSATVGPFSVPCRVAVSARGGVSVEITSGAVQALVSTPGNQPSATLAATVGTPGQIVRLSDGDDLGAILVWAIPAGASAYTWCWWLSPADAY